MLKELVITLDLNKTATRITEDSPTSIDLIFTNKAAKVTNASSFPLLFSDHDMIGCARKIYTIKYDPETNECRDWKPIEEASDVNKALKYFTTKVSKVFDRHAPIIQKKVKGRQCKWLTRKLKKEMDNED